MEAFKTGLIQTLSTKARVTILRISNFQVYFLFKIDTHFIKKNRSLVKINFLIFLKISFDKDGDIFVFFTLIEKADFYGNVPEPTDDIKSDGLLNY